MKATNHSSIKYQLGRRMSFQTRTHQFGKRGGCHCSRNKCSWVSLLRGVHILISNPFSNAQLTVIMTCYPNCFSFSEDIGTSCVVCSLIRLIVCEKIEYCVLRQKLFSHLLVALAHSSTIPQSSVREVPVVYDH